MISNRIPKIFINPGRGSSRVLSSAALTLFLILAVSCKDAASKTDAQKVEERVIQGAKDAGTDTSEISKGNIILFFGNSLTAGYGLETSEAFPALVQAKLDSLGLDFTVVNAGLSGDTTAAGKSRISWVMAENVDVFVLELGANDGLRGVPLSETRENLQAIIDVVREKNPEVHIILAGMQIPPNLGKEYTASFQKIFPELAEKNNTDLIPFLLEGVAGDPELNQEDGIHPTAEGQKIVAENVWEVLSGVLKE